MVLLSIGVSWGQNGEELFLTALSEYKNQQYQEALEHNLAIKNKGNALLYNIGCCYSELGNSVDAVVYWRKAQAGASWRVYDDASAAIKKVYGAAGKEYVLSSKQKLYASLNRFFSPFSLFQLQLFFILGWYLLFLIYYYDFRRLRALLMIVMMIGVSGVMVAIGIKWNSQRYQYGIVREEAVAFVGPDSDYHIMGRINPLDEVVIDKAVNGFYKIKTQQLTGWVAADMVEPI
jgi:hypothetical protein